MQANITSDQTVGPFVLQEAVRLPANNYPDGPQSWSVIIGGTWDGASVALQLAGDPDSSFVTPTNGTFTSDSAYVSDVPLSNYVQAVVTGSGASTDLDLSIQ